jgi:hypothetical protein
MRMLIVCVAYLISDSVILSSCKDIPHTDSDTEIMQTHTDLLKVKEEARDGYFEEYQRFKKNQTSKLNEIENRIEAYKKVYCLRKSHNPIQASLKMYLMRSIRL